VPLNDRVEVVREFFDLLSLELHLNHPFIDYASHPVGPHCYSTKIIISYQ